MATRKGWEKLHKAIIDYNVWPCIIPNMIIIPDNEVLYICCALGLVRGPKLSGMVPGSRFVDGGYTLIAEQLNHEPNDVERLKTINIFYQACYMVLIVDEPDRTMELFMRSLATTRKGLERAEIQHIVRTDAQVSALITSPEVNVLPVVFEKRAKQR